MTNHNDHDDRLHRRLRLSLADLIDPPHQRDENAPCVDCGARWNLRTHTLDHTEDCQWVVMVDSIDAQQD